MIARLVLSALLLPIAAACSGGGDTDRWAGTIDTLANGAVAIENFGAPLWSEGEAWTLREELRIGSAMSEGPDLFGRIRGIAVDPAGRIHVLDAQANELRTFDSAGHHISTIGREGSGPGEFRDPIGLALSPDGSHLVVVDPNNARYAAFGTDGTYVTGHRRAIPGYGLPWTGGFGSDGSFYEQFGPGVIRMDSAFLPADTLVFPAYETERYVLTTEDVITSTTVPFTSEQREQWDPRGYIWTGITGEYVLTQLGPGGDTLRIIRRTGVPRLPVTAEDETEALEAREWFRREGGRIDPSRIPSIKPHFTDFHVTPDGHVWVRRTPAPDEEGAVYDIFDPVGRYLGEVRTANSLGSDPVFLGRSIYAVVEDTLGVQYVVRYRVIPGTNQPE